MLTVSKTPKWNTFSRCSTFTPPCKMPSRNRIYNFSQSVASAPICLLPYPLDFSNVFCYTLPKLVDRISTATHSLRCVLSSPVERCERVSNERYLVLHIEYLSVSAVGSPFCIHTFCRKDGDRHVKRQELWWQESRRFASELPRKQVSLKKMIDFNVILFVLSLGRRYYEQYRSNGCGR